MQMDIHLWLKVLSVYHGSTHDFNSKKEEVARSFSTETAWGQSSGSDTVRSSQSDVLLWNLMAP